MKLIHRSIRFAKKRFANARHRNLVTLPKGRILISITFDDYPASTRVHATPLLNEYDAKSTFYVCMGLLTKNSNSGRIDSIDGVNSLISQGHEIGCHTYNHIDCASTPPETVRQDIERNSLAINQLVGTPPTSFAFPFGNYTPATKALAAEHYNSIRTSEPGINAGTVDLNNLNAIPLYPKTSDDSIKYLLQRARRLESAWLIFYTHDVSPNPSAWGCSPHLLRHLLDECHAHNIHLTPISHVARTLRRAATL